MHPTAMNNCQSFFQAYAKDFTGSKIRVVEIGSQDVNGSLRQVCPPEFEYIGVDFEAAKGVDIVLEDPYKLPFKNESVDIVVSSSCFEHSSMFWLTYLEVLRILKKRGLFYLNAPSSGNYHRYPVDCWRFYPDSAKALVEWAERNQYKPAVLESYTQLGGGWQDYVAVFLKDKVHADTFPSRILNTKEDFSNGQILGDQQILKFSGER